MKKSKKPLEPLASQIQTGYMIAKAVSSGTKYLEQALECLKQAQLDTNDDLESEIAMNVELGSVRNKIYRAMAGLQLAEIAHKELATKLNLLGYRQITSDDFAQYGVTQR